MMVQYCECCNTTQPADKAHEQGRHWSRQLVVTIYRSCAEEHTTWCCVLQAVLGRLSTSGLNFVFAQSLGVHRHKLCVTVCLRSAWVSLYRLELGVCMYGAYISIITQCGGQYGWSTGGYDERCGLPARQVCGWIRAKSSEVLPAASGWVAHPF